MTSSDSPCLVSTRSRRSRETWIKANGPIPDGLRVLHHCDNALCRNLEHLWLGTQADNLRDCREKGRLAVPAFAFAAAKRKLTAKDAADIRQIRAATGASYRQIASRYGVNPATVWQIVHGKSYR